MENMVIFTMEKSMAPAEFAKKHFKIDTHTHNNNCMASATFIYRKKNGKVIKKKR